MLGLCCLFASQTDRFLSADNLTLILQQVMVVGVIAVGQTLVILTAGIDLSCGMVMALGGIVMAKLTAESGLPPVLSLLAGMGVTTAFGLVNGGLVTQIRFPPFIVTLGTMNIALALTQLYSGARTLTDLPSLLTAPGNIVAIGSTGVCLGVVLMLLLYGLAFFLLRDTAAGRHVYAVGSNAEAARLMGIPVAGVLLAVYGLAGLCYGLAAWLSVARTGVGDPNAGQTENLDAITAVVLGGTSLFGGRGVMLGTLVGVLIVGVLRNGLTLMDLPSIYQVLVTGILVIMAVAIDQLARNPSV